MPSINDLNRLYRALHNPDKLVVELDYEDATGSVSRRKVSPIRRDGRSRVLVMCLATGQPRLLVVQRISNVRLLNAADVLIPEPKIIVHS